MPWDLCGVGELNLAEPKGDALARQFERDVAARESRALAMFAAANTEHPNPIGIEAQIFLRHFAAVMTDLRTEKRQLQGSDFDRAKAVVSVGELHKNRLSELVKTQPTATAHALLWAVCSREIGSPNESAACLSQSLSDWATLAPQSTSPHLAMLTAQVVRHPRQDPWPIMERITQAKIWQRIPIEPFSALWAAANFGGNGEANSPTYVAAQTYAVGVQLMQGIELYPGANATIAYQLCKEPDALTPSQRSLCSALALQLSTANTSLNDFAMAGSLGYHLKWPKSQIESAQAELQRHRQFSQRLLGNGSGFGCQSVKNGPGYFRSVLQNGEMATLRGQTPIKLNP